MPRYELPGQQGRKGNYHSRLGRPAVGVVPALLLFIAYRQGGAGNGNDTFQPLSICYGPVRFSRYASRAPVPEILSGRGVT